MEDRAPATGLVGGGRFLMCDACRLGRRAVLLGLVATPAVASRRKLRAPGPEAFRGLVEPRMHMAASAAPGDGPRVALTLDACDGRADMRILDVLRAEAIPATIFVTGYWLHNNRDVFRMLLAHPDLFEIGDHGARHLAAIDRPDDLWGVRAAGSAEGVRAEVGEGARLLEAAGAPRPGWYRGAAAWYSPAALTEIGAMGFRVAGFSLNGDEGASLPRAMVARRIAAARDGDVIISHVNQPLRSAGAGVVDGIKALKEKGFSFRRLSDPRIRVIASA